jgi:hypothetical protein
MKNTPATITSSTMLTFDDHKDEIDRRGDLDPHTDDGGEDQHDRGGNQVVAVPVGEVWDGLRCLPES